jgi:hypothetical protein
MATAQDIYLTNIRDLPQSEKLRLATIILEELSKTAGPVLDFSDSWSDQDLRDVTAYAQQYAATQIPE